MTSPHHSIARLLAAVPATYDPALADNIPLSLVHDSRESVQSSLFFALVGQQVDGHEYLAAVAKSGALAAVVQHSYPQVALPQIVVPDTRVALAHAAAVFCDHPSRRLKLAGITGTNGKTTTAYLLDSIARAAGQVTGLIGTVETRIAAQTQVSQRTTPEALALEQLLARMARAGVCSVAAEVSSHAIDLHRVDALHFAVVAFTNLTQDHLDYHRDMDSYRAVKLRLFTDFGTQARVINIDTAEGQGFVAELQKRNLPFLSVATQHDLGQAAQQADIYARDEQATATGTTFRLVMPTGQVSVTLPLPGAYNVSNACVAAACAYAEGIDLTAIEAGLSKAAQVPGRLESIDAGQAFSVVVDYAHTPDALAVALDALRAVTPGRLITVFGCGGDRDATKRAVMGRSAAKKSDLVFATSDNPRSEDPATILTQVKAGIREHDTPYEIIVSRAEAIEAAISAAQPGDCVLIAGKGHEDYQLFADRSIHFDDREVARAALTKEGYC